MPFKGATSNICHTYFFRALFFFLSFNIRTILFTLFHNIHRFSHPNFSFLLSRSSSLWSPPPFFPTFLPTSLPPFLTLSPSPSLSHSPSHASLHTQGIYPQLTFILYFDGSSALTRLYESTFPPSSLSLTSPSVPPFLSFSPSALARALSFHLFYPFFSPLSSFSSSSVTYFSLYLTPTLS